jgi:FkbM family methyltransferase
MFIFGRPIEDITLVRRLVTSAKRAWAKAAYPGDFIIRERRGERYLLNFRNYVDRQIDFHGRFEPLQKDFFFQSMKKTGCDLFLDIGANIGYYTVTAGMEPACKRVIAFEPDPRNAVQLKANLLINGLLDRVEVIEAAVTETSGRIGFAPAAAEFTGLSRISREAEETVPAVALDDLVTAKGDIIYAKIDVEGFELDALKGMKSLVGNNRVFIQCEVFADNMQAVDDWLSVNGLAKIKAIDHDQYYSNI